MLISTIIICKNAQDFIEPCVASVRQQQLPAAEIIVVDGDSNDGTTEWLQSQPDIHLIRQAGKGIANARNEGILAAKGKYISFLDADDIWMPDKLSTQFSFLENEPIVQAVTGHLIKSDDVQKAPWVAMTPGGFLFRREVFEQFGLFNEKWLVATDHEWLMRAIRQGMKYHTLPNIVLEKGIHGNNLSVVQKKLYRTEMMQVMRNK